MLLTQGGGETGITLLSPTVAKVLTYGLPLLTTCFMLTWPAALQISFFITGLLGLIQSRLFRSPWFRRKVGIAPIVRLPNPLSGAKAIPPSPYSGTLNIVPQKKGSAVDSDAPENLPKPKGVVDGAIAEVRGMGVEMKKSWDNLKGTAEAPGKRTEAEKRQAAAYEERRRKEIAQERWNRMEIQKERMREKEEKSKDAHKMKKRQG